MNKKPTTPTVAWLLIVAFLLSTFASVGFTRTTQAQVSEQSELSREEAQAVLSKYAVDLTQLAKEGKLRPNQSESI